MIAGAESWDDIAEFGESRADWFATFLDLPHGIPSHDIPSGSPEQSSGPR